MTRRELTAAEVLAGFKAGEIRGLARALSWIEDGDARGRAVLADVFPATGRARVFGVTGSPGAGKSTLVDRMAIQLAESGRKVAVLCVDPSSAFSGGAILGDRIRMSSAAALAGVTIRSMATRGHLGGLARATEDAVDLLDAFGFDDILLETVGVGQDEVDVIQVAHVNLLVLVPFMGDDIQAIKAGVMEIADTFVINKADRDGADRLEAQLLATLRLQDGEPRDIPIVRTVATTGEGVAELLGVAERLLARRLAEGGEDWRGERAHRRLLLGLRESLLSSFLERIGAAALANATAAVAARRLDPHGAVASLMAAGTGLDHLGLAVADVAASLAFWRDGLGLEVTHEEVVESEGVRVTLLPIGSASVELLEPLSADGAVASFLARRGPGLHHVCVEVNDIHAALERLRATGARIVGEAPRRGAKDRLVAFVHPQSTQGVLVELSQRAPLEGSLGGALGELTAGGAAAP